MVTVTEAPSGLLGKVYLETFGCQMNKLDSELLLGRLMSEGYGLTQNVKDADVILYNTCSVREHAEERVFSRAGAVKYLKKKKPNLVVGVVGCMAQNLQEQIVRRLSHVDLVAGPRHLGTVPRLIQEVQRTHVPQIAVEEFDQEYVGANHAESARATPFQAYVKAMEGCDCSCTFCIVPRVRGAEMSRPPDEIVDEVKRLAAQGCVEITLLGQTINSYGKGLRPRIDLGGLLCKVHDVNGIRRIRFITSHPIFVRPSLIEAMRDLPKVCKYLHIPAQSGSSRILKLMKRGYTAERYLDIVRQLRENVSGIEIASDFIVGFPTETDDDFAQTIALMEKARFQNSFVFKYSPRPETESAAWRDDVPTVVKKERNQILLDVQAHISREKNRVLIGSEAEVLVEGPSKSDIQKQCGRTDTNAIVVFEAPLQRGCTPHDLRGCFVRVKITDATAVTLYGELC